MMNRMEARDVEGPFPDWGQEQPRGPGFGARAWRLASLFGPPAVVLLLLIPAGVPPLVVAGLVLVYAAAAATWVASQGARALRAVGAREPRAGELERLDNLIGGLSGDLGIAPPVLLVTDEQGPNALVAKRSGYAVVVTADIRDLSRTELEAILAHCLVRIAARRVGAAQTGLAMGRLGAGLGGLTGAADDVVTASVTRYPPALASAIEKCEVRSGSLAPLWFVAQGPSHVPARDRISVLNDL
ncbi:MAG: hypothetical protein ACRDJL_07145, partial [Actinomycetota bacterium]